MPFSWRHAPILLALAALAAAPAAYAQPSGKEYVPQVGQQGKDVIWVPTPQALVERMLAMADVKPGDFVVDLGSGDGRTVITAVKKFGARALGIEYNPDMVELSRRAAEKEGASGRAEFVRGDIFATDFSQATVVTMYLLPSLNLKLRPTLLNMKPGTRLVSHAFTMDDWQADQIETVDGRTGYLWIVPAKVEGTWRWEMEGGGPRRYELVLAQHFQNIEGIVRADGKVAQFRNARLRGDVLTFSAIEITGPATTIRRDFTGRVAGDRITGTVKVQNGTTAEHKWVASRAPAGW
jgi:tRNA G37 N-methylase Trm5